VRPPTFVHSTPTRTNQTQKREGQHLAHVTAASLSCSRHATFILTSLFTVSQSVPPPKTLNRYEGWRSECTRSRAVSKDGSAALGPHMEYSLDAHIHTLSRGKADVTPYSACCLLTSRQYTQNEGLLCNRGLSRAQVNYSYSLRLFGDRLTNLPIFLSIVAQLSSLNAYSPRRPFEPWPRQLDRKLLDWNLTTTRQDSSTDLDRPRQTSTDPP
jgi:hypothetical protein